MSAAKAILRVGRFSSYGFHLMDSGNQWSHRERDREIERERERERERGRKFITPSLRPKFKERQGAKKRTPLSDPKV